MTTIAIGLFDGFPEAQRLIHTLVAQGAIQSEDITIIANREETSLSDVLVAVAWGVNVDPRPGESGPAGRVDRTRGPGGPGPAVCHGHRLRGRPPERRRGR